MRVRTTRAGLLILLAVGLSTPAFAKVSLWTLLRETDGTLEWYSQLGIGVIETPGNEFAFKPGETWGLFDYRRRIDTGPIGRGERGGVLFSDTAARAIVAAFAHPETERPVAGQASHRHATIAAIVIDPGHGGIDPGTSDDPFNRDPHQKPLLEKNITLAIGLNVYHRLEKRYPHKIIAITRTRDVYVSLERRTQIANAIRLKPNQEKIFVSIHVNASFDRRAQGFEVWYLPPTYQRRVISDKGLGSDASAIYPILNNLRQQEYENDSIRLGNDIRYGLHATVGAFEPDRGLKAQEWFVVRNSKMPAVLCEVAFLSNPKEARLLAKPSYLKRLAKGITLGIERFVNSFDRREPATPAPTTNSP